MYKALLVFPFLADLLYQIAVSASVISNEKSENNATAIFTCSTFELLSQNSATDWIRTNNKGIDIPMKLYTPLRTLWCAIMDLNHGPLAYQTSTLNQTELIAHIRTLSKIVFLAFNYQGNWRSVWELNPCLPIDSRI